MQPTTRRAFQQVQRRAFEFPGLYRKNTVPAWQRIHQTHDGLRQWQKGPNAKYMLYPYYALMISTSSACMYMMFRMVLGHKTWY
ncbi:hypothetical protein MBLNU230_g6828t1 [Neophaeotheca triangularis]